MKTEDCPVYQMMKGKVEPMKGSRRLTKADREEVDKALKGCPENCDDPNKCDRLNNIISDFAPPECRGSDHANAKARDQRPSPGELPQIRLAYSLIQLNRPLRIG